MKYHSVSQNTCIEYLLRISLSYKDQTSGILGTHGLYVGGGDVSSFIHLVSDHAFLLYESVFSSYKSFQGVLKIIWPSDAFLVAFSLEEYAIQSHSTTFFSKWLPVSICLGNVK